MIARALLRYQGFKAVVLGSVCVSMIGLVVVARQLGAFRLAMGDLFSHNWLEYLWAYWLAHSVFGVALVAVFVLFVLLDLGEQTFEYLAPPEIPDASDGELDRGLRRINILLALAVVPTVAIALPLTHLCFPRWTRTAVVMGQALAIVLSYWKAFVQPRAATVRKRLGRFRYRNSLTFDAASISGQSKEVVTELRRYERINRQSALGPAGMAWLLTGGQGARWRGLNRFYVDLAGYLGTEPNTISLHESTTAAIRSACAALKKKFDPDVVVTTDMEYPSVSRAIREQFPTAVVLSMREAAIERGPTGQQLTELFIERLKATAMPGKSLLCITSHVYYDTGLVLDLKRMREGIESLGGRSYLLIDGAQAVGNVTVNLDVLKMADAYGFSGHKWLMGKPALGILVCAGSRREMSTEDTQVGIRRPFSVYRRDEDYTGETVGLEPMISLGTMLSELKSLRDAAEHNRILASMFVAEAVRLRHFAPIIAEPESGIVTLQLTKGAKQVKAALQLRDGIACQALGDDKLLRFCFHYYHGDRDVCRLIRALQFQDSYPFGGHA